MRLLASISASITVLLASTAFADERLCTEGFQQAPQYLESFEVGPFFSSDGALLWSSFLIERKEQGRPIEILVCYRPTDPRCSPTGPAPEQQPLSIGRGLSGGVLPRAHDWPPIDGYQLLDLDALGLGPAAGVRSRVERPPRS